MLMTNSYKCFSKTPNYIYDEACLDIHLDKGVQNFSLSAQYSECVDCIFQEWNATQMNYLVNTKYELTIHTIFDGESCNQTLKFEEHARYGWDIGKNNCTNIYVKEAADNAYLPILVAIIVFLCLGAIWYMIKGIYKYIMKRETIRKYFRCRPSDVSNDLGSTADNPPVVDQPPSWKHSSRIRSIDVFRGFCIITMIFVNYGGGQYLIFQHTAWNGLAIADLLFPWFMWLMGFSIIISLRSRLRTAVSRKQIILHIIFRSFIFILIGLIIYSHMCYTALKNLRIPGVLQRLGITYCFVAILETIFTKRTHTENFGRLECVADILAAWPQWMVMFALIIIHTCLTFLLPVPGCPTGYLGPGGLQHYPDYENCTGGAAGYIDRSIFGSHMYDNPSKLYETKVMFDPHGLLGTLTSILIVYMGAQAARTMYTYKSSPGKIIRWISWSIITGLIAGLLCNFSKDKGVIPVNTRLFSLSFTLAVSSMAFFIECVLHILVDVTRKWGGRPFIYPGMNSLLLYIGHYFMKKTFPFAWVPSYPSHREYLAMNLWGTVLWVAISIFLYKRNIFFKI